MAATALLEGFGQIALMLLLAPLLNGAIKKAKARLQNRRGPSTLQPYFDLIKWLRKDEAVSEHASWVFRLAPPVAFGAMLVAGLIVPAVWLPAPLASIGDAIVLAGCFALARFVQAIAALDTGSNFGGMGASREMTITALVEPALFLGLLAVAVPAQTTNLSGMAGFGAGLTPLLLPPSYLLAFAALLIVAIAETGRVPVDNPDTHLELTMVHEGMLLEYSGKSLALLTWAALLKQLIVLSLIANVFFPWGIAADGSGELARGLGVFVAKVFALGLVLAVIETSYAKLRILRVPQLLGVSATLGLLAVIANYVVGV